MVTWNLGFLEIWAAHEFGSSVKLKLVPTVCPPWLVHRVPALILNSNDDVKNRLLYYGCSCACNAAMYVLHKVCV